MKIKSNLYVVLFTLFFYLLIVNSVEYLTTEKFLLIKTIPFLFKTYFLIGLLLIASVFLSVKKDYLRIPSTMILIVLFLLSVIGNDLYTRYSDYLRRVPKIFRLNKEWGVQGNVVEIEGKNFGPVWQPGEVKVDDLQFEIKSWSEERIETVQPVPNRFWKGNLYVINNYGQKSNSFEYEIYDPAKLNEKN